MTTTEELKSMEGRDAVDLDGVKLGEVEHVYLDDQTGQPLWVTIITGLLGTKHSFAPLHGARIDDGTLRLAVTKDLVSDAPEAAAGDHVEDSENDKLQAYYRGYLGDTAQDLSDQAQR